MDIAEMPDLIVDDRLGGIFRVNRHVSSIPVAAIGAAAALSSGRVLNAMAAERPYARR